MSAVITGLEKVLKNLKAIDRKMENKVVKPVVRKGLAPVRKQARLNCKWKSIRKLIGTKVFKNRKGEIRGKVYLRKGKDGRTIKIDGRQVGLEALGNILEFGSVKTKNPPRPFMRPAGGQAASASRNAMEVEFNKRIKQL